MQSVNLTQHFLIAMPALDDPNFFRSVTLVCQHDQDGAMGVVVKPVAPGIAASASRSAASGSASGRPASCTRA